MLENSFSPNDLGGSNLKSPKDTIIDVIFEEIVVATISGGKKINFRGSNSCKMGRDSTSASLHDTIRLKLI